MSIKVRNLTRAFKSGRRPAVLAVDDLSLEVADGELLAILGPSGSGKTTLLRCIAGLDRADRGEISVDGRVVYSSSTKIWVPPEQRGISMVFQHYGLWPHMTVFDNVAYPLKVSRVAAKEIRSRVGSVLAMVGCAALDRRYPSEVSGGQQQRVAVARAIVGGSRTVLFDEPLSSVDARVREDLRQELVALQRQLGFAAVYITHDQVEAMAMGHRVAVVDDGKIMQLAAPRDLYQRPTSAEVAEFLGATNQCFGTVTAVGDSSYTVTADGVEVLAARSVHDLNAHQEVRVIVRPEHCRLASDARPQGPNVWEATVVSSVFLGYCTEYVLRMGERRLTARSTAPGVIDPGSSVWLHVPPVDVHVLPV